MKEGTFMPDEKTIEELRKAFWDTKPVSSNDSTGLMQGQAIDNEVADTYAKMYNIPSPQGSNDSNASIGPDTGGNNKQTSKKVIEP